jgi:hypothetical protein
MISSRAGAKVFDLLLRCSINVFHEIPTEVSQTSSRSTPVPLSLLMTRAHIQKDFAFVVRLTISFSNSSSVILHHLDFSSSASKAVRASPVRGASDSILYSPSLVHMPTCEITWLAKPKCGGEFSCSDGRKVALTSLGRAKISDA